MALETEKILVLKAHYMGRIIAGEKGEINSVLDSIDKAINELEFKEGKKEKLRQIFYIILKAEILRENQNVIDLRKRAKEISENIGSNVYKFFMDVEDVTDSKNTVNGIQKGIISNYGIRNGLIVGFFDEHDSVRIDGVAAKILGIENQEITEKEADFLLNTDLKEMIEKHFKDTKF